MYAALNDQGDLVYASQASAGIWYCPQCKQQVLLKYSSKSKAYFSHLTACGQEARQLAGGESDLHKQAKATVGRAMTRLGYTVAYERPYPSTDQIADIYVEEWDWVIEIQKSGQSAATLRERSRLYNQIASHLCWLPIDLSDKSFCRSFQAWQYCLFNDWLGLHHWSYHPASQSLTLRYQLPIFWGPGEAFLCQRLPISTLIDSSQVDPKSPFRRRVYLPSQNHKGGYRRYAIQRDPASHSCLRALYQAGIQVANLPDWIFNDYRTRILRQPVWYLLARLLACQSRSQGLAQEVQTLYAQKVIQLRDLPFVSAHQLIDLLILEISNLFL